MDETSRSGGAAAAVATNPRKTSQNGYDDDDGMVEILARPRVYYPRWKIVRQQELYRHASTGSTSCSSSECHTIPADGLRLHRNDPCGLGAQAAVES